ncbi:MAG: hypothetical protein ACON3Z_02400 [Bradymonadia bacterium]
MLWLRQTHFFLFLGVLLGGCGGGVVTVLDAPPPAPPGTRPVQVVVTPPDAGLWVDGVYRGTVDRYRAGWIAIDQKTSTLELRSPGYYRAYYLVSADLKTLTVELLRVPKIH